ncbi:MAG TPA: hypothetical protein PLM81_07050 [Ginsengibacter sp.]|nr:hypothetical protein [Ginsengibacter sp.]HRP17045.1 hypothetical protein [Ginsengibacter sp.]HRP44431.1 hypothetical protein [Ginsengibacter sp.]
MVKIFPGFFSVARFFMPAMDKDIMGSFHFSFYLRVVLPILSKNKEYSLSTGMIAIRKI